MDKQSLQEWFSFQSGTPEQVAACVTIRTAMYRAAEAFRAASQPGPGQRHALRMAKTTLQAMIGQVVAPEPPDQAQL